MLFAPPSGWERKHPYSSQSIVVMGDVLYKFPHPHGSPSPGPFAGMLYPHHSPIKSAALPGGAAAPRGAGREARRARGFVAEGETVVQRCTLRGPSSNVRGMARQSVHPDHLLALMGRYVQ